MMKRRLDGYGSQPPMRGPAGPPAPAGGGMPTKRRLDGGAPGGAGLPNPISLPGGNPEDGNSAPNPMNIGEYTGEQGPNMGDPELAQLLKLLQGQMGAQRA